jgi:hypothetical protein
MSEYTYEVITYEDGLQSLKRVGSNGDVWFIPIDENNSDYQLYLNPKDGN